jgi:hypothetical protein
MFLDLRGSVCRSRVLFASTALAALLLPLAAQAQTATAVIGTVTAGSAPFLATASASYSGGTLAGVSYTITPLNGSVTRPLGASYSANYLGASSTATSGNVTIPIFGLYAGANNSINFTFTFTNGATFAPTTATTITTASYTDPCVSIANRTLNASPFNGQLSRTGQSDLGFDYFLMKDDCAGSTKFPAILDTDGNFRWVGSATTPVADSALVNNAIYLSDGGTGIDRIDLTNGTMTPLADYKSLNVTTTNQHNIDPGRNGFLLEVNTTSQTEATILEVNPATGAVMNTWDMGAILSAAMTAGGDSPANFVLGTSKDWFHNNATAYNPADNTLIVSSRESFVIAVDYDLPASGQRQIHWILGDTTKLWYTYPSLAKYALQMGSSSTLPPIGQHGVSIDHNGNLLLFDDGFGSLTLEPAGLTRNYSAARSYQINTSTMTATQVYNYTLADSDFAGGQVFSPICSSIYDVSGSYLVDFATANTAASFSSPNGPSTAAGNTALLNATLLGTSTPTSVILAGLGIGSGNGFILQLPAAATCEAWNAVPLASPSFNFNGYVNAPALPVAAGNTGTVTVAISGLSSVPTTLGVNGAPAVTNAVQYNLGGSYGTITAQFTNVTATSATLSVTLPANVTPTTIPYTLPITIGTAQVGIVTLIVPPQATSSSVNVTGATLSLAPGNGGTVNVTITGASSVPTLALGQTTSNVYNLGGNSGTIDYAFLNVSQSGALLVVYVPATVVPGSYSIPITIGTTTVGTLALTVPGSVSVSIAASTLAQNTFNSFAATISGATSAPANLGLGGVSCVNVPGCLVPLTGSSTPLNFEFSGVTSSSASLGVFVNPSVTPGTYAIPITIGTTVVGTFTLTVPGTLKTQTITFGAIAAQTVGTALNLTASASSGLAVSFSSSSSVCAVSGSTATFLLTGTCTITASQAGNGTYAAATPVLQSFTVNAAPTTVSVSIAASTLAPDSFNTFAVTISGASSAPTNLGLGGVSCVNIPGCLAPLSGSSTPLNFEFSSVTSSSALLAVFVNPSVTPGTYAIPITIGTTTVGKFALTVPQLTQTITFGAIAAQKVATPLSLTASASSGLAVSYNASPGSVCTVSGSTATFVGAGTCTITASQTGNSTYSAASPVSQSFTVSAGGATYSGVSPATLTLSATRHILSGTLTAGTGSVALSGTNLPTSGSNWTLKGLPTGVTYTVTATSTKVTFSLSSGTDATSSSATTITIYNGSGSTGKSFPLTVSVSSAL